MSALQENEMLQDRNPDRQNEGKGKGTAGRLDPDPSKHS